MAWGMFLSIPCPAKIWDERRGPGSWCICRLWGCSSVQSGRWQRILRAFRKTSSHLHRDLSRASVSAHRLYSPGRLHGLLRRDLVPAGFSDTAEDFEGLACRVVCRRVYDFPDARHVRSLPGFRREKRLLGLILIPVFSRFASSFCVFACRPMQTSQYASGFEAKQNKRQLTVLVILNVLAVLAGLLLLLHAWFTAAAIGAEAFALLVSFGAQRNLGGMSGDISGFSLTLGELAGLFAAACRTGGAMELIFGGAYQGKTQYAAEKYDLKDEEIFTCGEGRSTTPPAASAILSTSQRRAWTKVWTHAKSLNGKRLPLSA